MEKGSKDDTEAFLLPILLQKHLHFIEHNFHR